MSKPFSKLNFSLPFSMETAVPVDYNSYFTSFAEATAAASTATSAGLDDSIYYIGQQVYVVDNDEKTVKTYLISHDKTLVSAFDETEPAFTTWKNGKAIAAGYNAVAYSDGATALGNGAQANGDGAIAIGSGAKSQADGAVEIGAGTNNEPKTLAFRGFNLASITETETVTSCTIDNARLDIDATLTKSGSPADAKAAGDKFVAADSKAQQALDGVTTINKLIPQDAKPTNQLADKDFVNSSIATNTATFIGTFNLVTDLHLGVSATEEQIGTAISAHLTSLEPPVEPDNHDYCFVQIPFDESPVDPEHIEKVDRYKFAQDGSADPHSGKWKFEFSLNNSSFTSEQWATINSGLVEGDATLYLRGPNHDGFSSWAITPAIDNPVSAECLASFQQHYPNVTNGNLTIDSDLCICIGGQKATGKQDLSDDGLVLARNENGWVELNGYLGISEGDAIATRMPLSGYVLGKQDLKPLASETEAEELRQGKADDNAVVHLAGDQQTISTVLQLMNTLYAEDGVESHNGYRLTWRVGDEFAAELVISEDSISVRLSDENEPRYYKLQAGGGGTFALLENIAPAFGYSRLYGVGELCTSFDADSNHKGYWLYKCIVATDGSTPPETDTTHWTLATVEDVLAVLRTGKLDKIEAITWSDLKAKRDGSNLVPGQQYRITDYVATTNGDMSSQSANKPFDIVVTADDEHTLNESARAIPHEGDSYFDGCDLFAWKVWYCLDNDTSRFMWALANGATDSQTLTTGRGVVYRLIDEFGNDCPYDFKGLKFLAYGDTRQVYRFTFDSGSNSNVVDYSLNDGNNGRKVYGNAIKPFHDNNKKNRLNRIVLKGASVNSNTFDEGCNTITVGYGSSCNVFGCECEMVKFGDYCHGNNIGARCMDISAGNYFQNNTFGSGCTNFGIGDNCKFNEFGNGCNHIYFGTAADAQQMLPYYQLIRIEPGVNYVVLWAKSVTGDSSYIYENVTLCAGIHGNPSLAGTEYEYKLIEDTNINQDFKTTYQPANSKFLCVGNAVNTNEVQAQNVNFSGVMNTGEVYLG